MITWLLTFTDDTTREVHGESLTITEVFLHIRTRNGVGSETFVVANLKSWKEI